MNKKGFTLVEVIGVITILSLIVLVAFPNILGAMNKTGTTMDEATTTMLIANAKNYWNDYTIMVGEQDYCVSVKTLIVKNYTKTPISTVDEDKSENIANNYYVKATKNGYTTTATGAKIYQWKYTLTNDPGMACE